MDLRRRWPILDELCECAAGFPGMEIWVFGSMLRSEQPRDLDVLIIYGCREDVTSIRKMGYWELSLPPVEIIAMTRDEESHYDFINITNARRLIAA
ncbi:nucleotidyltransferase domain-containing protein [Streptomyces sp. NPDC094031]|uniref:nucleotidyltransferase domain-containing protein n=2 Tax=Streptomyces TaxID=1883 RepID=UPI003329899E